MEISLVVVVVGFIIGGVILGGSLIRSAELRATVSQLDELDSALVTFSMKYDCLPGDCENISSLLEGLTLTNGNGDWHIAYQAEGVPESMNAIRQLQYANLLDVNDEGSRFLIKGKATCVNGKQGAWWPIHMGHLTMPALTLVPEKGNYYWANALNTGPNNRPVFSPEDAYYIDSKKDDGLPLSGNILSSGSNQVSTYVAGSNIEVQPVFNPATDTGAPGADSPFCVTNETPAQYNTLNTSREDGSLCTMLVGAKF